jgi:hypothetical protein
MIWLGRLRTLLPEAKGVAFSTTASRYVRIAAFRALGEIGSPQDQEDVRQAFIKESPRLIRDWIGELVTDLLPDKDTIAWVLEAIAKSEDKERHSVDLMEDAVTSFTDGVLLEDMPRLLDGMGKLLSEAPVIERGYCEVSKRFSWTMKAAARAVERIVKVRNQHALHPDSLDILYKFRAIREWSDDFRNIKLEFVAQVSEWQELNDASFWHDVAATRKGVFRKDGGRLTDYWQAQIFGAFWKFEATDFDRVRGWVQSRPDQDDKLVALTLAFTRARRWQDRARARADGRAPLGRARVDAPVRGVQARPWRLRVRSSSPHTRAPGRERPTGCLDRRHGSGARRGSLCNLPARRRDAIA